MGWIEQGEHGQFHLARLDLLAEILRRAADHQAGQEHADDEVDEQVHQADALAAEDAVEPHAGKRRQTGQRIEAVVHAVDRAARHRRGHGRERRPRRGAETQLLAFEVAQLRLIDGQRRQGGDVDAVLALRSFGVGSQGRIGLLRVEVDGPTDHAEEHHEHDAVDDGGMSHLPEHSAEHDHQREREDQDADALEVVAPGAGVLVGVGRVGAEEAAAVGAEVLDGQHGGHRTASDGLRLRPAVIARAHRVRLDRGCGGGLLERHRHARRHQQDTAKQAGRDEHVGDHSPHIEVVIAHVTRRRAGRA